MFDYVGNKALLLRLLEFGILFVFSFDGFGSVVLSWRFFSQTVGCGYKLNVFHIFWNALPWYRRS